MCGWHADPPLVDMPEGDAREAAPVIPRGHGVEAQLAAAHQHNDAEADVNAVQHGHHHAAAAAADNVLPNVDHIKGRLTNTSLYLHQSPGQPGAAFDDVLHRHDAQEVQIGQALHDHVEPGDGDKITDEMGLVSPAIVDTAVDIGFEGDIQTMKRAPSASSGIFGHNAAAQPPSFAFGAAMSQLFLFGIPFAALFAAAAVALWKRLGDVQPHTSQRASSV